MKTQQINGNQIDFGEKSFYIDNYNNYDIYNRNIDQNPKFGKFKRKEIKFYYDNSIISESYGQSNVEKCLFILTCLILFSFVLGYIYIEIFSTLKFYILSITILLDLLVNVYYIYLYISLKNEQIFQKVSMTNYTGMDILIFLNYLNKVVFSLLIFWDNAFHYLWCIFFFSMKFIFDTYFIMVSLKLFMLSPCMIKIQEFFQRLWINVKLYILNCDAIEPDVPDYARLEELESYY